MAWAFKHGRRLLRHVGHERVNLGLETRGMRHLWKVSSRCLSSDDKVDHLQKIFDDKRYFKSFNNHGMLQKSCGLFKNSKLDSPEGLLLFSQQTLENARALVQKMNEDAEMDQMGRLSYIRKLDQLSDTLCRTIDVAEFIRVAHPDEKWVQVAQQTHELLFEYMNQLNINVKLYENLKAILDEPKLQAKLTGEEILVGEYLKQDFERSGIHMDPDTRGNFVAITQQISLLGSQYSNNINDMDSNWCELSTAEFNMIEDANLQKSISAAQPKDGKGQSDRVYIPLTNSIPYNILLTCRAESVRRKVWIALHNSLSEQIQTLDTFIKYRAILARMLGYQSFAHYQLEHKMAKNPENVTAFLHNLQQTLMNKENGVKYEVKKLYSYKDDFDPQLADDQILDQIKPWDREYLLHKLKTEALSKEDELEDITKYFSTGTVMAGLNMLFKLLYNVSLVPEPTEKGETWNSNQVRKLKVMDLSTDKVLGILYIDFWSPKVFPSHFTIVCLRKLNKDLGTETVQDMEHLVQLDETKKYQLPVISLVCNFQQASSTTFGLESLESLTGSYEAKPTYLSLDQVDTVFHEMGHAMHSMIGKTDLHNLSGTRCLTDFVELPSVLMEFFSRDPRVLCEFAKHYETGEPLSPALLSKYQQHKIVLNHCETFMQSKMALLDQALHSPDVFNNNIEKFQSALVYHSIESKLKLFADKWSTWHGKFPHLFSYGAVYYSYLLDRAMAEKIWAGLFEKDPWNSQAGQKYKQSILRWGGTKDPWVCMAEALDNNDLAKGDSKAMELIGQNLSTP